MALAITQFSGVIFFLSVWKNRHWMRPSSRFAPDWARGLIKVKQRAAYHEKKPLTSKFKALGKPLTSEVRSLVNDPNIAKMRFRRYIRIGAS